MTFLVDDLIQTLRTAARSRPLAPYEPLHVLSTRWSPGFPALIQRTLKTGWGHREGLAMRLEPPVQWVTSSRSFDTHWHAWRPLDDLFNAYVITQDDAFLAPARGFAMDWLQTFQAPLSPLSRSDAVQAALDHEKTQAWYDMSVALRLHRLAYLTDLALRDPGCPDADLALMVEGLIFHNRLLGDARLFRAHNNHGVFQALGQIAACARLPELPDAHQWRRLGERRLDRCLKSHFFDSGVHKEHSPGYHLTLLDTLISAREHGLIRSDQMAWLARAEEALGWMLAPDGGLAPIGDTDRPTGKPLPRGYVERYADPDVRALWSGERPRRMSVKAYGDAGYVFARAEDARGADYLAMQAGFHSRTHKHADHLAVIWWAGGREILTDPGRFGYRGRTQPGSPLARQGYWYADPDRILIERSRSHCVVEIDGQDHPRTDVRPFGSALRSAANQGEVLTVEAAVPLNAGVKWRRALVRVQNRCLLMIDHVRAPRPVQARQWLTLVPQWTPDDRAGLFRHQDGAVLSIRSLTPQARLEGVWRGQTEPDKRGWVAARPERLEPAPSMSLMAPLGREALFVTLIAPQVETVAAEHVTLNPRDLTGVVTWSQGRSSLSLRLYRQAGRLHAALSDVGQFQG